MGNDNTSPTRTAFGNHAFASYGGMVYDACAGPTTGSQTEAAYVASTIEQKLLRQGIQAIFQRKQLEP